MVIHFGPIQFLSRATRSFGLAVAFTLTLVFTPSAFAVKSTGTSTDTSQLQLKTERVVVFKDGYCLVVKQGTATTNAEGSVFTDDVPDAAVLGSFWAVPEQGRIQSLVAGWVDTESKTNRQVNCTSILEIVQSNLGKACSFEIGQQRFDGTLLKVLANDELPTEPMQLSLRSVGSDSSQLSPFSEMSAPRTSSTVVHSVTGAYFLIRTQFGDKMIQASAVNNLTIEDMNSSIDQRLTTRSRHKRISMQFGEANADVRLSLMYFRPDVRWIPTYRVNLTDQALVANKVKGGVDNIQKQKQAQLILQGEILNEAEDFVNVPFHVVVGVPNFRFRSVPSPMILEATMRNMLSQVAPNIMGASNNSFSNGLYSQRAGEFASNRAGGDPAHVAADLPDELIGKAGNDLFVYELTPITLKRGERAMVPILRTDVPYRDIYSWDIELTHSETYASSSAESNSPLQLSEAKIWRQVELINNTDIPWTTGAAMIMDGMQPLAQELLTYTSPGGICRVPVTVSVDLRGKVADSELKREFNALKWRGNDFARVEGNIEVELANNKTEPVPVEVRLRFGGKATQASDDGKIALEAFRAEDWRNHQGNPINNSCLVRWNASIAPGECFKPTVQYDFYLQH
ncbi:MAG: hypothetical protein KDA72_02200 [Planctomycetales bacterium]|nr:hypothetical protein [Planctomycetales bacterium]